MSLKGGADVASSMSLTCRADVKATRSPALEAAWRGVKYTACLMGCLFCLLGAMMFYGAMIEGLSSWSASLALCMICILMCRSLYRLAENERRLAKRAHQIWRRKG